MKLEYNISQYNNNLLKMKRQTLGQSKLKEHTVNKKEDYNNINRPAQAISFSGSAVSVGQKIGNHLLESNLLNKVIGGVNKNEAVFNAIFAVIIAGMLKPMLILKQTGKDDKDGQMIATKNFLQAIIGFVLSMTISGGFVKKIYDTMITDVKLIDAVKQDDKTVLNIKNPEDKSVKSIAKKRIIKENSKFKDKWAYAKKSIENENGFLNKLNTFRKKYSNYEYKPTEEEIAARAKNIINKFTLSNRIKVLRKNPEYISNLIENLNFRASDPMSARDAIKKGSHLIEAFESFWKNITGAPVAITKAMIASALLPFVVSAIFASRNAQKEKVHNLAAQNSKNTEKYKNFRKVANPDNKNSSISFKGSILNKVSNISAKGIEVSAKGVEWLAMRKPMQWIVDSISKVSESPSFLMSNVESFGITGYWLLNTHFSKKIDPDQKLGLNTHTALVTLVSSSLAYIIDSSSKFIINKAEDAYKNRIINSRNDVISNAKQDTSAKELAQEIAQKCSKLYNAQSISDMLKQDADIINNPEILKKEAGKLACTYGDHLKKFKSLTIFAIVVRFLVPVVMVKISKKIKKHLVEFSQQRAQKKREASKI